MTVREIRRLALGLASLLVAVPTMAISAIAVPAADHEAARLLFLTRSDVPGGSSDPAIVAHLRAQGYDVQLSDGLTDAPDPCGFALVVMSSTVRSNRFTADRTAIARWRDMAVPLLTWENDLLDDLRFTGQKVDSDFGEVETGHYGSIVRAPHPLAGGVTAGTTVWTEARQPAGWGKPGLGADTIMIRPGEPEKSMLFGYERGATMDHNFTAPARRTFIGLENDSFAHLTKEGQRMFDAAVRWTANSSRQCLQRRKP